jgi:voltage-gated potassium channel
VYRGAVSESGDRIELVTLAGRPAAPIVGVARRVAFAAGLLVFIGVVVYLGRDGYVDSAGGEIGFLDALYYASVTITTTGYGDIAAVTPATRFAALLLITPARILFLILVVGTTVEVLTQRSRQVLLAKRWRRRVRDHHIICGFGSTGRSASDALIAQGVSPESIVVVDVDPAAIESGNESGFTAVRGDASRVVVLQQAAIDTARSVIVTPNRDDTAVLVTLTARELNSDVAIVAAGRARENLHLLRQSGANSVIDSSAAVGRLLGLATQTPGALDVIDDLLNVGTALELAVVAPVRSGGGLHVPGDSVLVEILRDGVRLPFDHPDAGPFLDTDRLVVVRSAS